MEFHDPLPKVAGPVELTESETSYFSQVEQSLDPALFEGMRLRGWVRNTLNGALLNYLSSEFRHPEYWAHSWIAGSGASFQWSAARTPGDLDVLVGIDYVQFRKANPEYAGLSDTEISRMMNDGFRTVLQPAVNIEDYETTFYVNPRATDIRTINPYAAYDLTYDEWTVPPNPSAHAPTNPAWDDAAQRDREFAMQVATRYSQALTDVQNAPHDAARRNAETRLRMAVDMGAALYDEIHEGRRNAFNAAGEGYYDFHNYRWQAGKRLGTIGALKSLKQYKDAASEATAAETYGIELPSTDTLIRRAAAYRSKG